MIISIKSHFSVKIEVGLVIPKLGPVVDIVAVTSTAASRVENQFIVK